ncbi:thiamine pyrophosphate-dependent enzyme [Corynebacterium heidelbergense]|uniref:Pyruvate oxidase n=1 Tax=Corynebacterium heidelbergense TaxID=2055947 RepID=A0A364V8A8_9CORY|nr:thiamine pyrophosphate-dependent enzyme [Corynebacterium heidelbergense]RAV32848.1 pyruvate oxidase [Corynebacterium heidelbergense]RAV34518.1 pyruvate oxidase [Corynebacterium heidelbergense]WCZ35605.1 Pyruvate dehydrogenase [ubiquinone] [Corynebacterium heidelbergense]
MSKNVGELIVEALANNGVKSIWGVVGDALNPIVDAIRREDRVQWYGVRHEEAGAFAASAQAQLTGELAVCMGTVGPGAIHLLNGLYDAKKSHAPVLAIVGQVPSASIGTEFFQEVNNDVVFSDVAEFTATVNTPDQMPHLFEQAVNTAIARRGVAVLSVPADISGEKLPDEVRPPRFAPAPGDSIPGPSSIDAATTALSGESKVTLLVGCGAREARAEVMELSERLGAPQVLTLKGKTGMEDTNPWQVGQSGLIGNPAAVKAMNECDVLFLIGTDFPYREWIPEGKTVIQLDANAEHIGRRTQVNVALVGHSKPTLRALLDSLPKKDKLKKNTKWAEELKEKYEKWLEGQGQLAQPDFNRSLLGKLRSLGDNPDHKIRPEAVARALDKVCAQDTIFTSDTGMSTVWPARLLPMTGQRHLIGSYNLGSMANAMPMALGAQALDPKRQVVAFAGDGGLMMLVGDLRTAVTYDLPITVVVFNNSKLGMVKLEQEQVGLPEYGTDLDNPNFAELGTAMGYESVRVEDARELEDALRRAVNSPKPALVEVITNPNEVSVPGEIEPSQVFGFAKAKTMELLPEALTK